MLEADSQTRFVPLPGVSPSMKGSPRTPCKSHHSVRAPAFVRHGTASALPKRV